MQADELLPLVYEALDEVSDERAPGEPRAPKSAEARLLGSGAVLSSLELVRLILALEQLLLERFDVDLTLADERAMSRERSPFRSIAALVQFVGERLAEAGAA